MRSLSLLFQRISLVLLRAVSLIFHFTFSVSINLGETVISYGLEGYFNVAASLCSCVNPVFWCKDWFW